MDTALHFYHFDLTGSDPEDAGRALHRQCVLALLSALATIPTDEPKTLATFDRMMELSGNVATSLFDVAKSEGMEVTPRIATLCLLLPLAHWFEGGAAGAVMLASDLETHFSSLVSAQASFEQRVLHHVCALYDTFPVLTGSFAIGTQASRDLASGFIDLGTTLEHFGHYEAAFESYLAAANVAIPAGITHREAPARNALAAAKLSGKKDLLATARALLAMVMTGVAGIDESQRRHCYDLFEDAVRNLPDDPELRRSIAAQLLAGIDQIPYLTTLHIPLWLALPPEDRFELDPVAEQLHGAYDIIVDGPIEEWLRTIEETRTWLTAVENHLLTLEGKGRETASVDWVTLAMEYSSLLRAIPQGRLIFRQRDLDNFLLILTHETTHVLTMTGAVSIALVALRGAVFDEEMWFWWQHGYPGEEVLMRIERGEIAPLGERDFFFNADIGFVLRLERIAELTRKIQIIEDLWEPWFEGVAVFGEHAIDPAVAPDGVSDIMKILNNLWDRGLETRAAETGSTVAEQYIRDLAEMEGRLSAAINSNDAYYRLRDYLVEDRQRYLPGYLITRSIVSSWRETIGGDLSGPLAYTLLVHVTRYGALDTIPDLSLPIDQFTEQALERYQSWLRWLTTITAAEIHAITSHTNPETSSTLYGWTNGRLSEVPEEIDPEAIFATYVRQARGSLRGENADRVAGASDDCRIALQAMARSAEKDLRENYGESTVGERLAGTLRRYNIFPIGHVFCRFWLFPDELKLGCLIRTMEEHVDTGAPSYNMLMIPLNEEEYRSLEREVRSRGDLRMQVTRIADLVRQSGTAPEERDGRMEGMSYLVFGYGDWLHVFPAGLAMGVEARSESLQEDIAARLNRNPLVETIERLVGPDYPGMRRALEWLEEHEYCTINLEGDASFDLTQWLNHVRERTREVIERKKHTGTFHQRMLSFIFGDDETVEALDSIGLQALTGRDTEALRSLIRLLGATARSPSLGAGESATASALFGEHCPIIRPGKAGWDVAPPIFYSYGQLEAT